MTIENDDFVDGRLVSIPQNLIAKRGNIVSIPLNIDNANGVQALDAKIGFDNNLYSIPETILSTTAVTQGWTLTSNPDENNGEITISAFGASPLDTGEAQLLSIDLKLKEDVALHQKTNINIVSLSLNEDEISSTLRDGIIKVVPDSFQVLNDTKIASGIVLELSENLDLEKLNIYDGQDEATDLPDIKLSGDEVGEVPLSCLLYTSDAADE